MIYIPFAVFEKTIKSGKICFCWKKGKKKENNFPKSFYSPNDENESAGIKSVPLYQIL